MHPSNEVSSIFSSDCGNSTFLSAEQLQNALSPIDVTDGDIEIVLSEIQPKNVLFRIDPADLILIELNELHPENAQLPSDVTDGGISIVLSDVHSKKAKSPIDIIDGGISILDNEVHL